MFQQSLFDANAGGSPARLAAIDFFDGDRAKADAVIQSGQFVFLPKVRSFAELGFEILHRVYPGVKLRGFNKHDAEWQGECECRDTGGKITRYGYFCLRHCPKRGFLDR